MYVQRRRFTLMSGCAAVKESRYTLPFHVYMTRSATVLALLSCPMYCFGSPNDAYSPIRVSTRDLFRSLIPCMRLVAQRETRCAHSLLSQHSVTLSVVKLLACVRSLLSQQSVTLSLLLFCQHVYIPCSLVNR